MEYVIQVTKVSENLEHAEASTRAPKTALYAIFLSKHNFSNKFYICSDFCINRHFPNLFSEH